MRCPYCQATDTQVLDTRKLDQGASIRRRRRCEQCGRRFTTIERVEPPSLLVIKKSGTREPYDRSKVLNGVRTALYRRPIAPDAAERLVNEVEAELMARDLDEIPSSVIGDLVMERLRALDEVAYIRFASVYRAFTDVGSLREAVDALRRAGAER
ncbi:transcriptional regulator NrdR [Kallotenue papyrolyticum]|uniref:transcriptional regulator NrdR n=1 Tax=Kallotenue papyrolyticum TaxID=1325125 RepID=UPI000492D54D|nr:transcriptional regulator NrdR [Kallotenue papyrolyticum]